MGCDIHMYVEYMVDDAWYNCDYFVPRRSTRNYDASHYVHIPIYDGRNYSLFAILANVRNYGDTDYISKPRGLPENASKFVKDEYESWYDDAHSASYLTLKELIIFHEENHPLKRRGMIGREAQEQLELGILPEFWCQGTSDPTWEWHEWTEENHVLEPLIDKLKTRADEINFIYKFMWNSRFEKDRMRALELADDLRIVFWFDN